MRRLALRILIVSVVASALIGIWLLLQAEFLAITLLALPPGCVLGWFFSTLSMGAVYQELFRLPVVIKPGTYVFGAAVILVAMLASTLIIRYRIAKLDLVSALKYKE